MDNLKEKTADGLLWSAVNNGTMQVLNLIIGIVLGRLLSPEDYGVVGVLTIFTAIAGCLQASGFTQGLINLKQPTANDYNAVFWFNITVSLICYTVLFFSAPLIALFFKQPVLTDVSRVLFLNLPISALGIAQNGYMLKNMMNRELAIISMVALVASGTTGVTLAWLGKSYWSLVWQQLVYISVFNLGRYYYSPWRPSLRIDMSPVRRMFPFSVKLLFTNILAVLNQQLLTFVFGRIYSAGSRVGQFSQANKWNMMGSQTITGMLQQVAQTVLVAARDEQERELRVFRKMMRFAAFVGFPAMLGLALVAREFIVLTVGAQWEPCVPMLQLLCVGGAFLPLQTLFQNLLVSSGRSDLFMRLSIAQMVLQLVIVLAFCRADMLVMVAAYAAFNVVWTAAWMPAARRLVGLRLTDVLRDTLPFLLAAIVAMAAAWAATLAVEQPLLLFGLRVVVAAAVYAAIMKVCRAEIFNETVSYLLRRGSKDSQVR